MMQTKPQQCHCFRGTVGFTIVLFLLTSLFVALATAQQPNDQLTGNWVVRTPNADGTSRTTYLNLKQDGQRITGSIRVTQFYYLITESTGGADGFTITGTMRDGKNDRKVQYQGKLAGDQLHISTRRRPEDKPEGGRHSSGNILTNKKFPDLKALADYVHKKGLKLGIYSSPGPNTCAGYEGSYGHEQQDARTYAAWGIDYLKYDWCGARTL